jgi:hypothetical protein
MSAADPYAAVPFTLAYLDHLRRILADFEADAGHLRELCEFHGVQMGNGKGWRERAAAAKAREPEEIAAAELMEERVAVMRAKLAAYEAEFDRRAARPLSPVQEEA